VVQAIESEPEASNSVLGVQWHPEYLFTHAPQRRLFGWLVRTAARSRERRGAEPP
jgi:gamma-glutamyl-gamma-aminobutyrate hydrolase PuuD